MLENPNEKLKALQKKKKKKKSRQKIIYNFTRKFIEK